MTAALAGRAGQYVAVARRAGGGRSELGERRPYVMTLLYTALAPATALIGIIAFGNHATVAGFAFGAVFAFSLWQLTWWRARTGHSAFSHRFAFEAGEALGLPEWLVVLLEAYFFIICVIVVPAVFILGILT
jgi:hypothetical protein